MEETDFRLPVLVSSAAVTLTALRANGAEGAVAREAADSDLLERFPPPFDLTSDMFFAAALCPVAPLQQTFPDVPFLSLGGRAALVMWFSRVKEICYTDQPGQRHCLGSVETVLYNELNVIALLRRRALFVPGIYATSDLTIRVGHHYGMPKRATTMRVQVDGGCVQSRVVDGSRQSFLRARLLGSGRVLARVVSLFWPWRAWPARFPSGSQVRPLIQATPRVQLAYIQAGRLDLWAAWLPDPVPLLPLGLYVPNLGMQLPPPESLIPNLAEAVDSDRHK